jgi:type VI secretion system secreted protein VgrG
MEAKASRRVMHIATPLGEDLQFYRMSAREELSRLFEYRVELLSAKSDIDIDKILGKSVTIKVALTDDRDRCFNGYVTRFALTGSVGRYHLYEATVHPWLWFLTRTRDCRIFQDLTVPEIVKQVFEDHSVAAFELRLTGEYRRWGYCVQYRETDFNFVSRLMEQEGIYYYFEHAEDKHTLVLADSLSAHKSYDGYAEVPFIVPQRMSRPEVECIQSWCYRREIAPGKYETDDYDFEKPGSDLTAKATLRHKHAHDDYEVYDYPGEYHERADGDRYARTRIEELQVEFETVRAAGNCRGLGTGCLFTLARHDRKDQNREYLLTSTDYELKHSGYEGLDQAGSSFGVSLTALPSALQFRPRCTTHKPIVQGPQTAVVVGPAGDEIYTDKHGRLKVQFHWDRRGKKDENSSCWIRVSHPWAGKNWGMVAIPRIGQEVIVDFLEGDPDRPIITGRVYNADQMPPYDLPANKTQTGVKTRSSMEGSPANFNEIRFEDKKGGEQLYIHAEKNQDIVVENDESHSVGHDRTKTIDHDETTHVKHDRTETVDNNEKIAIGVDRTETVGSNESITVGNNRSVTVGASETKTVALQRTHSVGVNETIAIGAAQEVAIGAFQAVAIGAYQTVNVGANQDVDVGTNQSTKVGTNQSTSVGANQSVDVGKNASMSVGSDESRSVTGGRTTSIGKDDSLTVGKNLVISAGDSVSITTGSASITMKKDGTIVIKGKDITVEGSGKINVKASSDIVMKGSKILQN